MKKKNYLLLFIVMFCLLISKTYAITIRETMDENDGYSTLEEGSIIIGVTRFSSDTIVTASKAATAGVNDVILYLSKNGSTDGYQNPRVYYYVDPYVGWFFLDVNNKATPVDNEEELEKLSNLDIYYTNNVEKVLEVDFPNENIDTNTLPDGVTYKDNKLYINATLQKVEFETIDDKKVSLELDTTTSTFIENVKTCYTVSNGTILSYNKDCGSDIVIPIEINEEKITAIGVNAFKETNLTNVVIPSEIISIGSNAFANNNLETVIIKEKYDSSNFEFYGDNVFGNFNNIIYDNELTRMLNYIDNKFIIKYYETFEVTRLKNEIIQDEILRNYIYYDSIDKIKNNGYNEEFIYCYGTCDYESQYINGEETSLKNVYGFGFKSLEENKYEIIIEKYDASKNKVYSATTKINVSFQMAGIKENYDIVQNAIKNLQMDERFEEEFNDRENFTRIKYLQDLEDLYGIEIKQTNLNYGTGLDGENGILHHAKGLTAYCLIDGIIYDTIDHIMLIGYENRYFSTLLSNDYDNFDVHVEEVIKKFVKDTGVNNYYIYSNVDGKIYGKAKQKHKTGIDYEIELIDIDYSEKWTIEFIDYYEDKYDENGFTKTECFGFENGTITSYDGTCGPNVKMPNQINGIDVIKINGHFSSLFSDSGIKSVILPNKLQEIGFAVFTNNKITELTLPETIKHIESGAFSGNQIKNIVIPDSLISMGHSVFSNNQIETIKIGSNLDTISLGTFMSNKIKKVEIPKNIKLIDESAFKNNEIEELILNEGLEIIEMSGFEDNKIKKLELPKTIKKIYNAAFNNNQLEDDEAFIYDRKYNEENETYEIDYETVVSYGGKNREIVTVPSNVKYISDYAFFDCYIKEIKLPYGLKTIGEYALHDNLLTKLTIPNTVTEIGYEALNANKYTDENAFIFMHDEDGNVDKTNLVAYITKEHYQFEELIIPDTVKKIWPYAVTSHAIVNNLVIPYGVEEIGDYAFQNLQIKNSVSLPKSINKIGIEIFPDIYTLENDLEKSLVYARNEDGTIDKTILMAYKYYYSDSILTLPEGIIEIRENVFNNNSSLEKILLPNTLEKIGNNAFYNARVNEITIPSNVKSIGNNAFNINNGTLNIFIENKTTEEDFEYLGDNPFGNANKVVYENMIEVTGLILNKNNTTLSIGETETLIATIEPSNATNQNIIWTSSNNDIVTIDNGIITAIDEGAAIITATLNGISSTCNVTVNEKYSYVWEKINVSTIDEYYLYIVNSKGEKVSGKVNITYQNDKAKEHEVSETGLKIVKNAVNSVEIISIN